VHTSPTPVDVTWQVEMGPADVNKINGHLQTMLDAEEVLVRIATTPVRRSPTAMVAIALRKLICGLASW
jgi:hypothetical protein